MTTRAKSNPSRDKGRAHRQPLRQQGLRPIQIWVPDVRSPDLAKEAHRQSLAVASSPHAKEDQDFIDAISDWGRRVRSGEIWTAAGAKDYAGKPRPVLVLQDDRFDTTDSITTCGITTDPEPAPRFRVRVEPGDTNGLRAPSQVMADKVTTLARTKLGIRVGRLTDEDTVRVNRALLVFLGIAGPGASV